MDVKPAVRANADLRQDGQRGVDVHDDVIIVGIVLFGRSEERLDGIKDTLRLRSLLYSVLMPPRSLVVGGTLNRIVHEQVFVAKVDRLVCIIGSAHQKIREHGEIPARNELLYGQRVDVMNINPSVDRSVCTRKIASEIPGNDLRPNMFPFRRGIEALVQISLGAERLTSDLRAKTQVIEPPEKIRDSNQLGVRFEDLIHW